MPIFTSRKAPVVYATFKIQSEPSIGHKLSFGTSLAKVNRDSCKVFMCDERKVNNYIYFLSTLFLLTTIANNTRC